MRTALVTSLILLTNLSLVSCSNFSAITAPSSAEPTAMAPRSSAVNTIRGAETSGIENALDKYDQEKMSHALDKPLGRSSEWSNPRTGINYTVTPVAKLTYNGNPYCRRYKIVSSRNGQGTGTACVSASDSSWQIVN